MFNQKRGPQWGILYLVLPLAVGLFWLEVKAPLSEAGHRVAQVCVMLLTYGLVALWLRANRLAILNEDYRKQKKNGRQSRRWIIHREELSEEEPGSSSVQPALPPVVNAGVNDQGRVPRSLVTTWSAADSGPLPIQHSGSDSQMNVWTEETDD
jgi:hypothetical protein